jgi:capsular polysaccharide transport system permease protein
MATSIRSLLAGWGVQQRTLHALFVRDLMMRYGRAHLGFVWVILEAMILAVGVMCLWLTLKGEYEHGIKIVELILTGYMLLTLWRHITGPMVLLFRRSSALLYHRQVSTYDIFFSRVLLEFAAATTALVVLTFTMLVAGFIDPVQDWSLVIGGWLLMALLATGMGSLIVLMTEKNETTEKFIQPVQYLLIPLSGTFYMVAWLPTGFQNAVLLNPLIHTYEMVRGGFFGPSVETHFSVIYVLTWAFCLNFWGIWGIQRIRRDLQFS